MKTRITISDSAFNILEVLDNEIISPSWEFNRIGGCGSFNFSLPRDYCDEKYISGDFNIKIYGRNDSTSTFDLWYQGLVEAKMPNIRGDEEKISVQGHGYQAQLSRIYLNGVTYTGQEVSVIIKDLLDNYIVPYTNISYSASDIEATTFTPSSIKFSTDAMSAIQTLADIVGTREWGVDEDRNFYFKARSSSIGYRFTLGGKVTSFSSDDSFKDIINRVIIQGGDVAGVPYTDTFNDVISQLKYGRRDSVISNSSVTTSDVATRLASSVFAEKNDVVRRGSCEIADYEVRMEATIPIPLFALVTRRPFYNEKFYGTFLYGGEISYQINKIGYKLNNEGSLTINLDLGKPRPDISETIGQMEYELEQLRSASI
jgi:hypothetical protein